eukprot:4729229-Pyramimonas_sp.AAC.1
MRELYRMRAIDAQLSWSICHLAAERRTYMLRHCRCLRKTSVDDSTHRACWNRISPARWEHRRRPCRSLERT